jgi:hypothetical protein
MRCKVRRCEVRPFGRKQWWSPVPAAYRTPVQPGICPWTRMEDPVLPIPQLRARCLLAQRGIEDASECRDRSNPTLI